MKIGIISDVHSNIQALNVVMAKFDEEYFLNGLPEHIHDNKRKMSKEEIENHKKHLNCIKILK